MKFIGEREKGIYRKREKEKCLREEIEEKIEILTEGKQKIRRDCDKDWTGIKRKSDKSQMVVKQG